MAVTGATLQLAAGLRMQVAGDVDAATQELTAAWVAAWSEVVAEWEDAVADLVAAADGTAPTAGMVRRAARAQAALATTHRLLEDLQARVPVRVMGAVPSLVGEAARWERLIIASQYPDQAGPTASIAARFSAPDAGQVQAIVDRTAQRVTTAAARIAPTADAAIRAGLVRGVAHGLHPDAAARVIMGRVGAGFHGGLHRARVIARTEMLDAHRAAQAVQDAKAGAVVSGWQWAASLDSRTCFPAGTLITTSEGDKPIEEIADGDVVLSHAGQWRRAYDPMSRRYSGKMVTVTAGGFEVTCTSDHPVLVEREGELQWMEARGIRPGDSVLSHRESGPHGVNHAFGERAVEGCRVEPQDGYAAPLHEGVLAGVAVAGAGVPVGLVHLDADAGVGEVEVERTLPARHGVLLDEVAAERFERKAHVGLGLRLAGVASIAACRAEAATFGRDASESVAADRALDHLRRPSALFGAVGHRAALRVEDASAGFARGEGEVRVRARKAAVAVPAGVGSRHGELFAAADARLGDASGGGPALSGARLGRALRAGFEGVAAVLARSLDLGRGVAALPAVGALPLVGVVAFGGTEAPRRLASGPRRRDLEKGSAPLASEFHRHIVSSVATHYQTLTVYNFEVETDHSYVANGLAVHNCPSCLVMHGTTHPVTDPGPLDHQQGRCARIPTVVSWAELGFPDLDEPGSAVPDARAWFDGLPANTRAAIMGAERVNLLDTGRVAWTDLASMRDNPGWRPSIVPTPVRDLTAA